MTPSTLQEMLDKIPFEPFKMCLSNGESYPVLNPHMVAIMKSKVFVAIPDSEQWAFVSYPHIAALKTLGNGHGTPRRKPRR